MANTNDTVIIGTGIIGLSTAYYLSQSSPSTRIHLIEASPRLFSSASGYSAGFLASDWYGPATASLGALSFRLHKELAIENDGRKRWGYSRSTGTSHVAGKRPENSGGADLRGVGAREQMAGTHEYSEGKGPAWLTRSEGDKVDILGEDNSTAQVDPLSLCKFLLGELLDSGVRLHQPAKVTALSVDNKSVLNGVRIKGEEDGGKEYDVDCARLVITAGAWTADVFESLFTYAKSTLPIGRLAGHSLVVRSPRWTAAHEANGCHAVFSTDSDGYSPEVFSRIGGEIYIAGLNDPDLELPEPETLPSLPDDDAVRRLKRTAARMLGLASGEDDLEIVREGLCFRPITEKGPPIVTRLADEKLGGGMKTRAGKNGGVFVSAGHGPWGVALSLGTGKVMSELIEDKPTSANIKSLGV